MRTAHRYDCAELWKLHGVEREFLLSNPSGAGWGCDVCEAVDVDAGSGVHSSTMEADDRALAVQRCLTCGGFPPGHPECAGVAFAQTFPDIPRAMWFVFVTVTTVGYGDVSPTTWQGQLFGAMVILCGVIFLAMPITSVGNQFTRVWEERQMFLLVEGMRHQLMREGIAPDDVESAFKKVDDNGDGQIDAQEFSNFVTKTLKLRMSRAELHQLWTSLDIDQLGSVDFTEFTATLFPDQTSKMMTEHASFIQRGGKDKVDERVTSTRSDASDDAAAAQGGAVTKDEQGGADTKSEQGGVEATSAVEARLASVETQLATMQAMMQAIHDGVHDMAERTVTIEQSLHRRRARKDELNGSPPSLAIKEKPSSPSGSQRALARSHTATPSVVAVSPDDADGRHRHRHRHRSHADGLEEAPRQNGYLKA